MPKPQLKTYLSPEFQSELKDLTDGHFFKQKHSGLTGIQPDKQNLKIIATKSMNDTKKGQMDQLEVRNVDQRTTNMQRIRSTESSCSSTPVSTSGKNRNVKDKIAPNNGSASVGPKKMTKNSMQMSIADAAKNNKTPGKSYIYRMNTSFSTKEGKSTVTSPTVDNNLPTISQTSKFCS